MFRKAFTLVEIMVVVAIIAVLATIGIANLFRVIKSANEANAQAILKTISNACENYATANSGSYPAAISDLTTGDPVYLNADYTAAAQRGYSFACGTLTVTGYSCTATPTSCNTTGSKNFAIDTGGVLTSAGCS